MELAFDTGFTSTSAVFELDTGVELGSSRVFVVEVIEDAVDVLKLIATEEMA